MRAAMKNSVLKMLSEHKDTILILIDIGAYGFSEHIAQNPKQIRNIGIFEPGTVSLAAGMSLAGITPTVYGISPFIVQRSLEQLKLDFVYQDVGGNFITTGASYDFSALGYSHYCPEDVMTLKTLPGFEILTPGTPSQFETLFNCCCMNGNPSYFRMTDHCNRHDVEVEFGKAAIIKRGKKATIVVFAEMLDVVVNVCKDLDVTLLYYTTANPFDYDSLKSNLKEDKLILCHPFYEGTFADDIIKLTSDMRLRLCEICVPKKVIRSYGTKNDKDIHFGFTEDNIRNKIKNFIGE